MEDGGYYAIKGFEFQVDKTIKEIFDPERADDEEIWIENIQDLNTDDFVTQVKYKETQEFSEYKIRDPILQLLNLSINDNGNRNYILYCHFTDKEKSRIKFDLAGIKSILKISSKSNSSAAHLEKIKTIESLNDLDIQSFAERFTLEFADSYSPHFSEVISIISKQNFCVNSVDAVYYYAIIANYLRKLVIENGTVTKRLCDRKTVLEMIGDGKKSLFYGSFEEYKGRENFLNFLISNTPNLYKNQSNYFIFGGRCSGSSEQIAKAIESIVRKYYKSAVHDLCPPTFILQDGVCTNVKRVLVALDIVVNDGFEDLGFNENIFHRKAIVLRKLMSNKKPSDVLEDISFHAKVISRTSFEKLTASKLQPSRVLYFGEDEIPTLIPFSAFLVTDIHHNEVPSLVRI
jgi:hypothetical protein